MTDAGLYRALRAEAATFWHRLPDAMELGDLVSEGWLAYQSALPRATSFPHKFGMRRARGAMMDAMRRWRGGTPHRKAPTVEPFDLVHHDQPDTSTPFVPRLTADVPALLDAIPPRQADVLRRVVLAGDPPAAVAASMGVTPNAVMVLKSKGLSRLRQLVAA